MPSPQTVTRAFFLLFVLSAGFLPKAQAFHSFGHKTAARTIADEIRLTEGSDSGAFVRRSTGESTVCVRATSRQALDLRSRATDSLAVVTAVPPGPQTGLRIMLRGTPQLQNFPAAITAFNRAAALWEARIQTVENIVIDVDFGPTMFGSQFDDGVVAAVDSQTIDGNSLYPAVRAKLDSGPYDPIQRSFYRSLPAASIPTDQGAATGVLTTSASLRALNLIDATAEPDRELPDFGPPPAIAINSKFEFDFDPSDGIDADKLDFESIVLHDIGHVLGLVSSVGEREMDPSLRVDPSLWDLFRIRPNATADFASSQRVLSSGGEQVFFAGGTIRDLSTARPDGVGGDGRPAAHWKDDDLTNVYLGIMDPTIGAGQRQFISDDDLAALDAIGYRTISIVDPTTVVPLNFGVPQVGVIIAPPPGFGVLSHLQYSIIVPPGASELKIDLSGDQDVDLFGRFGRPVVNQGHAVIADYRAATDSNSESLTITSSSSPALDQGIYYFAVANFGPGDANFTITATVTGGAVGHSPAIFNIVSHLEGDFVRLDCSAVDLDADLSAASITLLDEGGQPVGSASSVEIAGASSAPVELELQIGGLSLAPTARMADVVLLDQTGNRSAEVLFDFGQAEPGALTLSNGSFSGSKLKLKVRGQLSDLAVEINGRVLGLSQKIKMNEPGSKLTVKGTAEALGMHEGLNRVRVRNNNGWSNILLVSL